MGEDKGGGKNLCLSPPQPCLPPQGGKRIRDTHFAKIQLLMKERARKAIFYYTGF